MNINDNIDVFLRSQRSKTIGFLQKRYRLSTEDAEDCFQEGSVAVWRNIHEGRLTADNLTCSLSTYLIQCCCNHASHMIRGRGRDSEFESLEYKMTGDGEVSDTAVVDDSDDGEREALLRAMEEVVQNMTSPCREILWYTYYDKLPQTEIAQMCGLKNADTVSSQKVRCMKKLKERMYSIFNAH